MPLTLKSENSFVSASHSLLTWTAFRYSEDAAGVQVAVTIATVVAARLRGVSHVGRLASTAEWANLA